MIVKGEGTRRGGGMRRVMENAKTDGESRGQMISPIIETRSSLPFVVPLAIGSCVKIDADIFLRRGLPVSSLHTRRHVSFFVSFSISSGRQHPSIDDKAVVFVIGLESSYLSSRASRPSRS